MRHLAARVRINLRGAVWEGWFTTRKTCDVHKQRVYLADFMLWIGSELYTLGWVWEQGVSVEFMNFQPSDSVGKMLRRMFGDKAHREDCFLWQTLDLEVPHE